MKASVVLDVSPVRISRAICLVRAEAKMALDASVAFSAVSMSVMKFTERVVRLWRTWNGVHALNSCESVRAAWHRCARPDHWIVAIEVV